MASDDPARRASGSDAPSDTPMAQSEQPDTRGTVFLMLVFLMAVFGFWFMMYAILLER